MILIDINGYLISLHITRYRWIFEKLMNINGYLYVIEAFLNIQIFQQISKDVNGYQRDIKGCHCEDTLNIDLGIKTKNYLIHLKKFLSLIIFY